MSTLRPRPALASMSTADTAPTLSSATQPTSPRPASGRPPAQRAWLGYCVVYNNYYCRKSINRWSCTITEKAPTRAFSWLKAATTAFTFETLLRHYAKRAFSRGLLRDYESSDGTFWSTSWLTLTCALCHRVGGEDTPPSGGGPSRELQGAAGAQQGEEEELPDRVHRGFAQWEEEELAAGVQCHQDRGEAWRHQQGGRPQQ